MMFVKYKDLDSATDGVAYMFQKAQQAGKPIAVNMSLGTIDGPHDGTTASEQLLAGVLGTDVPGRSLIIAAGNSGSQTIHARSASLPAKIGDTPASYPHIVMTAYPREYVGVVPVVPVEIYYPHGSNFKVSVVYPADAMYTQTAQTPWVEPGNTYEQTSIQVGPLAGGYIGILHESPSALGNTDLNRVLIVLGNNSNPMIPLESYKYYILLDGAGVAIDAWHIFRDKGCLVPRSAVTNPPTTMLDADDWYTVARPASMTGSICVGSYVSKTQWTDVDAQTQTQQGATLNAISGFSSRGRRRDEVQKPDLCGPGEVIISTLAANYTDAPRAHVERDGVHQKMQGTSQSAPHVCGVAALMLQKNQTLTQSQIKNHLKNTAIDQGTSGWDGIWGAGKMDALAALNAVPADGATPTPTATLPPTPTSPPGNPGDVNLDGLLDTRDAIRLLRHVEGIEVLTGQALVNADANQDSAVNNADVDWILDRTVGK